MPMPIPREDEGHDAFIDRCMSDEVMVEDFPDAAQRQAVCESQWRERESAGAQARLAAFIAEQQQTWGQIVKAASAPRQARGKSSFRVENAVAQEAELWLFGDIGYDWFTDSGIAAKDVADILQTVTAKSLTVHLNSPGGDLFEGLSLYAVLRNHPSTVTVLVEGLAASAGSIVAMAGDRILMSRGSMMMIHEPSGITMGPASAHQKTMEFLNQVADNMASIYADRGGKRTNWRAKMQSELWLSDQQAVDLGLADEVLSQPAVTANFDLSRYKNVPPELQAMPTPPAPEPTPATSQEPPVVASSAAVSATDQEPGFSPVSAQLMIDLAEAEVAVTR